MGKKSTKDGKKLLFSQPKVRGVALGGLQAGYRAVNPDPVQDGHVRDAFRAWAEFMRSLLVF